MPEPQGPATSTDTAGFPGTIDPWMIGLASGLLGFGIGQAQHGDPSILTQPLQTMSLLDYRRNLGEHYANLDAQQQLAAQQHLAEFQLRQAEEQRKQEEQYTKRVHENEIRAYMGLAPISLPAIPGAGPGTFPATVHNLSAASRAPVSTTPPADRYSQTNRLAAQEEPEAPLPAQAPTGQTLPGYDRTFELTPNGISMKLTPIVPTSVLGKTMADYEQFLKTHKPGSPNFERMDQAYQSTIKEQSRGTFNTKLAKIYDDIRFIKETAGSTPEGQQLAQQVIRDLWTQYREEMNPVRHESVIGKLIHDRAQYAPDGARPDPKIYAMITEAIEAERAGPGMEKGLQLVGMYVKSSDNFTTVQENFLSVASAYHGTLRHTGDPFADKTIIFGYLKIIDPRSVVRETEESGVVNMGSVPAQLRQYFDFKTGKLMTGVILPPEVRANLYNQAVTAYDGKLQGQKRIEQFYMTTAANLGIPTESIVPFTGRKLTPEQAEAYIKRARKVMATLPRLYEHEGSNLNEVTINSIAEGMMIGDGFDPSSLIQLQAQ